MFEVEGRASLAYSYHRLLPWTGQDAPRTHKTDIYQSGFEPSQLIIRFAIDNVKVSVLRLFGPSIREGISVLFLLGKPMTARILKNQSISQDFCCI